MAKAKRGMKMRLGPGWTLSARAKNSQQLFVQTSTSAKARCLRSLPCGSTKRSPRRTGPGPVVGEMLCGHAVQDYISILTRPIEEPFAAPGNRQPCPDCSSLSITLKQNGNGGRPVENWYAALDILSRLGAPPSESFGEALQEFFEDVVEFLWVVDKEGVTVAVESL